MFVLIEITQSFATESNVYSLKHWKNNVQSVRFKDSADKQFIKFTLEVHTFLDLSLRIVLAKR